MSEKQELIKRMAELQQQFIKLEHKGSINPQDFYAPPAGHLLENYPEEYQTMAARVLELAHAEVGSKR